MKVVFKLSPDGVLTVIARNVPIVIEEAGEIVDNTVSTVKTCKWCGEKSVTGRRRVYCSAICADAAHLQMTRIKNKEISLERKKAKARKARAKKV